MALPYRLLVYISGHGYGHVAQIAPILNQVALHYPHVELVICSAVSEVFLRSRLQMAFTYHQRSADFGMLMQSALEVDVAASVSAYLEFHADWDARVEREKAWIAELEVDAVLSNVAYLPLAAAARLGLPAVATCSLNWADIIRHYSDIPELDTVQQQIRAAYASAHSFLRLEPSMPIPWLPCHEVGPVTDVVQDNRALVLQKLGLANVNQPRLILVGMGGIATEINPACFPSLPGVHWLLPQSCMSNVQRADFHAQESLQQHFSVLLASSDLVLTKPGYGTFVEAACHGVPVLYVPRDGWPEQDCLVDWLNIRGQCQILHADQLANGDFSEVVLDMLAQEKPTKVIPSGNQEAAQWLAGQLGFN